MEVDFDKEIDAILRKAHRDGPVLVGDFAGSRHLDADEISAFAENAMSEKSRALYTVHLADCDRCRKILSNILVMNREALPATAPAGVITIAERDLPWYRKLFLFPNLAYVTGGLVLVFGGFLAFTIVQNSGMGDAAVVSQVADTESTRGGPNFQDEPALDASSVANANTNAMANSAPAPTPGVSANTAIGSAFDADGGAGGGGREDKGFLADAAPMSGATSTSPPPPPPAVVAESAPTDMVVREKDDIAKAKVAPGVQPQGPAKSNADSNLYSVRGQTQMNSPAQSGPSRNSENQYDRQLENLDRRRAAAADKKESRDAESSSGRRAVGGRTFERKQGVWYDTAYQGRPTINVRRGSDEFNRLDGNLRSIATSLGGTVVVVWGSKAYRIQ